MREKIEEMRKRRLDRKVNRLWGEAMHADPMRVGKASQKLCRALDGYFQ